MRPNFLFLLAASNALLKLGGSLKCKKRLAKDVRLSLQLTEVMKIVRLISLLPEVLRLSSPRVRATCSSLSSKLNPKSVFSLLRSDPGFSSSSSSSPNFLNCSSPRKLASVFTNYPRPHFSVSHPKTSHSRAKGYLFELRRAKCPERSWTVAERCLQRPSSTTKYHPLIQLHVFCPANFHQVLLLASGRLQTPKRNVRHCTLNSRLNVVVRSPTTFGLGRNGCWPSRGSQLPMVLPFVFSPCCSLNDRSRAAHSFFKIGRLFSLFLFFCPSSSPHSSPSLDER